MNRDLHKKIVLIVGGNSPVGQALISSYLNVDYAVVYTYRTENTDTTNLNQIMLTDNNVLSYKMDVLSESEIIDVLLKIENHFGKLDVVVYNSGISIDSKIEDMEVSDWKLVIDTNLTGSFIVTKHCISLMKKNNYGKIIYVGSIVGQTSGIGVSSYSASKIALSSLAKSVMHEHSQNNITANVVALGYTNVGMIKKISTKVLDRIIPNIPLKKIGEINEIADFIVELTSDKGNYITGQTINISGGL